MVMAETHTADSGNARHRIAFRRGTVRVDVCADERDSEQIRLAEALVGRIGKEFKTRPDRTHWDKNLEEGVLCDYLDWSFYLGGRDENGDDGGSEEFWRCADEWLENKSWDSERRMWEEFGREWEERIGELAKDDDYAYFVTVDTLSVWEK